MDELNKEFTTEKTDNNDTAYTYYQDYTSDTQNQTSYSGNPYAANASDNNGGTSGFAVAALVFGILAILLGCCTGCLGLICGIVGIIFAVVDKKNGPNGVAKGGLVCSIIGLIISILMTVFMVIYFYAVGQMATTMMESPDAYMEMMEEMGGLSDDEMEEMREILEQLEQMEDMY